MESDDMVVDLNKDLEDLEKDLENLEEDLEKHFGRKFGGGFEGFGGGFG